jgi:hypothetical protein
MMRLYNDPLWQELKPFLHVNGERRNVDVRSSVRDAPNQLFDRVVAFVDLCVTCKNSHHPVRVRGQGDSRVSGTSAAGHLFLTPTCATKRCSRTNEARSERTELLSRMGYAGPDGLVQQNEALRKTLERVGAYFANEVERARSVYGGLEMARKSADPESAVTQVLANESNRWKQEAERHKIAARRIAEVLKDPG